MRIQATRVTDGSDDPTSEPARGRWRLPPPILIAVTVLVLVAAFVAIGGEDGPQQTSQTDPPSPYPTATSTPNPAPSPSPATETPPPSPEASGSDTPAPAQNAADARAAGKAAARFSEVWLDLGATKPRMRRPRLRKVAVSALADQLSIVDPANLPRGHVLGDPHSSSASKFTAVFEVRLSSGTAVDVTVVRQANGDWLVAEIQPATGSCWRCRTFR